MKGKLKLGWKGFNFRKLVPSTAKLANKKGKLVFKLLSSYVVILLCMIAVGGTALYASKQSEQAVKMMYEERLQSVSSMLQLSAMFDKLNREIVTTLLMKTAQAKEHLNTVMEIKDDVDQRIKDLEANYKKYSIPTEDVKTFMIIWERYTTDLNTMVDWINKGEMAFGSGTGMTVALSTYNTNLLTKTEVLDRYLQEAVDRNTQLAQQSYDSAKTLQQSMTILQTALIVIAVILSCVIGYLVARSIVNPLKLVVSAASEIAVGNLNQRVQVKNRDELGQLADSFNQMAENIRTLIKQVQQAGSRVTSSSEELKASTDQTKQAINQIALMIEEVATGAETQVKGLRTAGKRSTKWWKAFNRFHVTLPPFPNPPWLCRRKRKKGTCPFKGPSIKWGRSKQRLEIRPRLSRHWKSARVTLAKL